MTTIACAVLSLFVIALFGRIILSYFPLNEGGVFASIYSVLYNVTEPVLGPLRRVIPTIGMFDLSPLIVFFVIQLVLRPVLGCSPGGL